MKPEYLSEQHCAAKKPDEDIKRSNTCFLYVGYMIVVLGGFICGAMFLTRLSITVAMLSMVNHTHMYLLENPNATLDVFASDYVEVGEFVWTNEIRQSMISGYMIAYTIPQVLTTKLAVKYGIRRTIPFSLGICAFASLLTPALAYMGWEWILAFRLLNGIGASALLPCMIGVVEKWVPRSKSATGLAVLQFTQTSLFALCPLISGLLTIIHWKWAFYVPGLAALTLCIIWYLFVRDDPKLSPFMSQKEMDALKGIGHEVCSNVTDCERNETENETKEVVVRTDLPWYFMFKVKSFYCFVPIWMVYCSTSQGFLYVLPSYFHTVLKLRVEHNGFYNFLVQVGAPLAMLLPGPEVAFIQSRFKLSLTGARRVALFIHVSLSIMTWAYVAIFHEYQIVAILLNRLFHTTIDTLVTSTLMSQFSGDGLSTSVYSMMNTFGHFTNVIFCWLVGKLLDMTGESLACWSGIFAALCIMNALAFVIYALFLRSEPVVIERAQDTKSPNEFYRVRIEK